MLTDHSDKLAKCNTSVIKANLVNYQLNLFQCRLNVATDSKLTSFVNYRFQSLKPILNRPIQAVNWSINPFIINKVLSKPSEIEFGSKQSTSMDRLWTFELDRSKLHSTRRYEIDYVNSLISNAGYQSLNKRRRAVTTLPLRVKLLH